MSRLIIEVVTERVAELLVAIAEAMEVAIDAVDVGIGSSSCDSGARTSLKEPLRKGSAHASAELIATI